MKVGRTPTVASILVAAGSGTRLGRGENTPPKQFLYLHGQPMYQWPLKVFLQHPAIDWVVVVTLKEKLSDVQEEVGSEKVTVIEGGSTRQESVWLALEHLAKGQNVPEFVTVHDACRPFLTGWMIDFALQAASESGASSVALPVSDTIKRAEDGFVVETLERDQLFQVQTPQAARFDWLLAAHRKARQEQLATTDDASILESAGYPVRLVSGSSYNLKVTAGDDMEIAELLSEHLFKSFARRDNL